MKLKRVKALFSPYPTSDVVILTHKELSSFIFCLVPFSQDMCIYKYHEAIRGIGEKQNIVVVLFQN